MICKEFSIEAQKFREGLFGHNLLFLYGFTAETDIAVFGHVGDDYMEQPSFRVITHNALGQTATGIVDMEFVTWTSGLVLIADKKKDIFTDPHAFSASPMDPVDGLQPSVTLGNPSKKNAYGSDIFIPTVGSTGMLPRLGNDIVEPGDHPPGVLRGLPSSIHVFRSMLIEYDNGRYAI